MNFFLYRAGSLYQFFEFWWMFLIGNRSMKLQQANETKIVPWIALEWGFQFWVFWTKFQVWWWVFCAASWSLWLGLYSGLSIEPIRSRILIKISCIHGFWDLIFKIFFQIFSMCFCTNHDQFSPNLSLFEYARIIE